MKSIYIISAALALCAASVAAENFDATAYTLQVVRGDVSASMDIVASAIDAVSLGIQGFEHTLGPVNAAVRGQLQYSISDSTLALRGEYLTAYQSLYGITALEYVSAESTLEGGDWVFEQTVGADYALTDIVTAYAQIEHSWDISDQLVSAGGVVELGLDLGVTQQISINPYVSRGYSSANDDWSAGLVATYTF